MADEKKTVIIDLKFDVSDFTQSAAKLNKEISYLNKQQAELKKQGQEGSIQYQKNSEALRENRKELAEVNKTISNLTTANKANAGSNEQLKAQLSIMTLEYNKLSEEQRKNSARGKELFTQINQTTATLKENEKAVGDNRREVGNYALILSELKAELKAAKGEAFAMGQQYGVASKEFQEASARAGELADKIKETNEATNVFTTGSKFEQFGNSLKGVGGDLASLDFEGASEKANQLLAISKSMTFKEAISGATSFGTTVKAVGASLLTNPVFLLAAALIAVGLAAKQMYDSIAAGDSILKENAENLKGITKETDLLIQKNQELAIKEKVATKEITKESGEAQLIRLKQRQDFNNAHKELLEQQAKDEKELNDKINEEKSIFGIGNRKLEEVRQQGLAEIRAKYDEQERVLIANSVKEKKLAENEIVENTKEAEKEKSNIRKEKLKQIDEERKEQERLFQEVIKREVAAQQQLDEIAISNIKDKRERELAELDASFEAKQAAIVGDGEKQKELELQLLAEQTKAKNELLQQYKNEDDEKKAVERQMELELQEILAENELASLIELEKAKADAKIAEIQRVAAINQSSEIETALAIAKVEKEKTNNIKSYEKQLTDIKKAENKARLESTMIVLEAVNSLALGSTKAAKGVALAQLAISTGKSIASIVEMATAAGSAAGTAAGVVTAGIGAAPAFTAMKTLTYLTALGQIMGNFAQAKNIINEGKAAKGGIFGGKSHSEGGTKGYFDDGTQIEVEKGELFAGINKRNTSMLNYLNGLNTFGGNGKSFFERGGISKFADGGIGYANVSKGIDQSQQTMNNIVDIIKNMPNPVVVVQDINNVQSDVQTVEVISQI